MRRFPIAAGLVLIAAAAAAAAPDTRFRPPRTSFGHPDLEGVWNFNSDVPLERPASAADRKVFTREELEQRRATIRKGVSAVKQLAPIESAGLVFLDNPLYTEDLRTSLITYPTNGKLPAVVEGASRSPRTQDILLLLGNAKDGPPPGFAALLAAFSGGKKETYKDFGLSERCLTAADVPMLPDLEDNFVQIVQGADHVALITDAHLRSVDLTGAATAVEPTWAGHSRGHWDGDTLVVETKNFNGRSDSFAGIGKARNKTVTERITRISPTILQYSATIVDSSTFKDRIEISFPLARVEAQIYEDACHEGNYSLKNALTVIAQQP